MDKGSIPDWLSFVVALLGLIAFLFGAGAVIQVFEKTGTIAIGLVMGACGVVFAPTIYIYFITRRKWPTGNKLTIWGNLSSMESVNM